MSGITDRFSSVHSQELLQTQIDTDLLIVSRKSINGLNFDEDLNVPAGGFTNDPEKFLNRERLELSPRPNFSQLGYTHAVLADVVCRLCAYHRPVSIRVLEPRISGPLVSFFDSTEKILESVIQSSEGTAKKLYRYGPQFVIFRSINCKLGLLMSVLNASPLYPVSSLSLFQGVVVEFTTDIQPGFQSFSLGLVGVELEIERTESRLGRHGRPCNRGFDVRNPELQALGSVILVGMTGKVNLSRGRAGAYLRLPRRHRPSPSPSRHLRRLLPR